MVVELKIGKFRAEYAGKLNFYLNAVDDQIRRPHHNETVGILLCTGRNRQVVEYALRGVEAPIGVSTYTVDRTALTKELPPDLEQQLPSVGELTTGLQRIVDERASELAVAWTRRNLGSSWCIAAGGAGRFARSCLHSRLEVVPAPLGDLDLGLGELARLLREGIQQHDQPLRARTQ